MATVRDNRRAFLKPLALVGVLAALLLATAPDPGRAVTAGSITMQAPTRDVLWTDVNCDGVVDAFDVFQELRHVAGLSVTQTEPCPDIASDVSVTEGSTTTTRKWGDADCDGDVDALDALKKLRHVAGLSITQEAGCPVLGATVQIKIPTGEFGEWGGVIIPAGKCAVIGLSKAYSGTLRALGEGIGHGAQLAAEGRDIQGFCIDFFEADDRCNAEGGLAAAEILIARPNLIAVQGSICSVVNVAVQPRYEEAHITQVSGASTAFVVTHPVGRAPFETFLRTVAIDPTQGDRQAAFAIDELGAQTAFVTYDTDAYGFMLQGYFVEGFEARGGTVVGTQGWERGTVEFSALVTSVLAEDPDIVYTAGFDPEAAAFVSQLRDAGYTGPFLVGDGVFTAQFIELAGPAAEGTYLTAPRAAESASLDVFKAAYTEAHPTGEEWDYVPFTPQAHDATLAIILAAQEVAVVFEGDLHIDLLALNQAIHALSFDGVSYHIEFDANGDVTFGPDDMPIGIYQVVGGEYEYVTNK